MSISRKNWSALSSKARQWTMEDDEEVERERRRRVKSSTSNVDPEDEDEVRTHQDAAAEDGAFETERSVTSSGGVESTQTLDFVEMLRARDEKRKLRHVETLRRQKEVEEDDDVNSSSDKDRDRVSTSVPTPAEPSRTTIRLSSSSSSSSSSSRNSSSSSSVTNGQREKSSPAREDPAARAPPRAGHKFVSSVSFSMDTSRSPSGSSSPTSPFSPPPALRSPGGQGSCTSPKSPVHNGNTAEVVSKASFGFSSINGDPEQTPTPAFSRHSSRTVSFRMMKKKEEETSPLQRSASVRMTSKKFEPVLDKEEEEEKDKLSSFQRNSRQRVSSRTIQEKMERLAQAAQRSDPSRGAEVTPRSLYLMDEVSKKRGIFEKEPQASTSTGVSRQEPRPVKTGVSDRINRWLNKTNAPGTSQTPSDVKHVDISSKRSLFEN